MRAGRARLQTRDLVRARWVTNVAARQPVVAQARALCEENYG